MSIEEAKRLAPDIALIHVDIVHDKVRARVLVGTAREGDDLSHSSGPVSCEREGAGEGPATPVATQPPMLSHADPRC